MWIDFSIWLEGNYEFLKSQFFIFSSWIIFILFWIQNFIQKREIVFSRVLFPILIVLWISTFFSLSSSTSLFWLDIKWHWSLMFLCLIWLYIVLIQQDKNFMKQYFYASICWAFFASILAIKEYHLPTFSYWDLENRALATFGHPNYLIWYLLLLIPFLFKKVKKQKLLYIALIPIIITVFLTKSAWGILIFLWYTFYLLFFNKGIQGKQKKEQVKAQEYSLMLLSLLLLSIFIYIMSQFWFSTKLHSFLSRFYIWESTLRIIIDNPKILLFWSGTDTLFAYFESYKWPELYIFENFWFSSDRPHNLFLNILFHFWTWWILISILLAKKIFKKYKNNYLYHSLILVFLFTFFNFLSVASYLIIILICSCLAIQKTIKFSVFFPLIFIIWWIFSIYSSYHYTASEIQAHSWKYRQAISIFPYNYKNYEYISDWENIIKYAWYFTQNFYITQLDTQNTQFICDKYIADYNSVESAFYCGNYAWTLWEQDLAKKYYNIWFAILPDLWNSDSQYHSHFIVSQFVDGTRFFSKKYSNLEEILKRVWIENIFLPINWL